MNDPLERKCQRCNTCDREILRLKQELQKWVDRARTYKKQLDALKEKQP